MDVLRDVTGNKETVVAGRDIRLGGGGERGKIVIVPHIMPIHFWTHILVVLLLLAVLWRQTIIFNEFKRLESTILAHEIHYQMEARK